MIYPLYIVSASVSFGINECCNQQCPYISLGLKGSREWTDLLHSLKHPSYKHLLRYQRHRDHPHQMQHVESIKWKEETKLLFLIWSLLAHKFLVLLYLSFCLKYWKSGNIELDLTCDNPKIFIWCCVTR